MALLIVTLGMALFVAVHVVPMVPEWRAALVFVVVIAWLAYRMPR